MIQIKKIAVLGAGVMGAQIAAHCVNSGFKTYLYDLASDGKDRNALAHKAIQSLTKLMPMPLATPDLARIITAKNYQDDLPLLSECDLIIEAIAERLDLKSKLFAQISPFLNSETIVVSNSSGLSMQALADALPEQHRQHFCGVHFFNPPRYMHLAELIPTERTDAKLLDNLEEWLTRNLGKCVVRAKDTPNFIANRVGVFSLLATIYHAERLGLEIDEVDAITGTLLNRPKSATYRTLDVVGLDTMKHVVRTMQEALPHDPWRHLFSLPTWMEKLIEQGAIGQKVGYGIYRKSGKQIEVFNSKKQQYQPIQHEASAELKAILAGENKMERLFASTDKQAQFLCAYFTDLFHYAAYHLVEIASSVRDIDEAMQWGFGWKEGPFEVWQKAGVMWMLSKIKENAALTHITVPAWLDGLDAFYQDNVNAFEPAHHSYMAKRALPVYQRQMNTRKPFLYENAGVELTQLEDVAVVSFKSKANAINHAVLDGLQEVLSYAEKHCQGLIVYQKNPALFSAGADLKMVSESIKSGQKETLRTLISSFQQTVQKLRYSAIPVVAALRGQALGGGCELLMHCDRTIAAFESYPGLVEIGVGLIPAGGGCKEWARRAALAESQDEQTRLIQQFFEQTAMAYVSTSATDAVKRGYLQQSDVILMNANEVLYGALNSVKSMCSLNYTPPQQLMFKAAGMEMHAKLQARLVNLLEGEFISPHDYFIANQLAYVICGGDVNNHEMIDEIYLMKLELDAFMSLVETPETQARIAHLLETGKALRN